MAEKEKEGEKEAEEAKAEKGTDLFDEVFGAGKGEKEQPSGMEKAKEGEKAGEGKTKKGKKKGKSPVKAVKGKVEREDESREEGRETGQGKGKERENAGKGEEGAEKEGEEEPSPEQRENLREKIKKVVVAKAAKAAEKEARPPDQEAGIKEKGIKESDAKEREKEEKGEEKKPKVKPNLGFLEGSDERVFIGRKGSVFKKYGEEAGLFVGQVKEEDKKGKKVLLDSLNPHVVFVCGARGSGKSYIMGVIAEEIARKNKNVGTIVIDPVGVFWSMRFPNKEQRELELLAKWGLLPQGLDNLKVFIPKGIVDQTPKNTYDATFSMPPSLLTTDDWCLTFGIDRFSPSGLLLEKALYKVKEGYKNKDGKKVKGRKGLFSLDELVTCLNSDEELNSSEKGYKPDSIRALVSRFEAAKGWGVFDEKGTPLAELSRENQMTVIDTSFLDDNVSALVIGILARRILAARKISTRQESAQRYKEERDVDKLLEYGIPPTWLFIDEAHTLIPSGNTITPASNALVEYVKQGRQPGCSIVFATQQPSAIHTKVLSQLDLMIAHKLVFDDDIKAVYKRTPTIIPRNYKKSTFIKTLPVGTALVGDRREETTRAFILSVRPRLSQHEGREAETAERKGELSKKEVLLLAVEMAYSKLNSAGSMEPATLDQMIKTLNSKYSSSLKLSEVLTELEKKEGVEIDSESGRASIPGLEEEEGEEEEEVIGEPEEEVKAEEREALPEEELELLSFPARVGMEEARKNFNSMRKKRFLGLFGSEEALESVQRRHLPVYKVEMHAFNSKQTFHKAEAFINSVTGEFLHFLAGKEKFIESKGLQEMENITEKEAKILMLLERKKELEAIVKESGEPEATVKRALKSLMDKGFAAAKQSAGTNFYYLAKEIDLPKTPLHPLLPSLNKLPLKNVSAMSLMRERVSREKIPKILKKMWPSALVKKISLVYLPVYECFLKKKDGSTRRVLVEAVTGKQISTGN